MADAATPSGGLIKQKWGPLPVWGWGLLVLGLAWGYSKYKSSKASAAATVDTAATSPTDSGESEATAPQFIIENNMPQGSTPVTVPVGPSTPVVTPPGTAPGPPVSTPVPTPPKKVTPPAKKPPIKYVVKRGDNLSTIAEKYKTTAAKLFTYNTTPGVRPASTIATLKSRGPSLVYAGETILIPQS